MKKQILDAITSSNIAEIVIKQKGGKDKLKHLGRLVCEAHKENKDTMKSWTRILESGIKLNEPDDRAKSHPWDGASNYKSPICAEAIRDFGDKATMEILSSPDLVAGDYEGERDEQKKEACERIAKHMNYQLNQEIKSWRDEQRNLFYRLAAQGSLFKMTWFDSVIGHNSSEVVGHPNFSINNECQTLDEPHKFTHIRRYTPNMMFENQAQGIWLSNDEVEFSHINNETNDCDADYYEFLEQITNFDLDDDGYAEPILVTVHTQTQQVVRVTALWDHDTITVKLNDTVSSYQDMQERILSQPVQPMMSDEEFLDHTNDEVEKAKKECSLVSIRAIDMLTHYKFINPADGTLLNHGFNHIMISGMKGVNKSANLLFNAGDLSNEQGGFLGKEFRDSVKGPISLKPGEWKQTKIPSSQLQNAVLPLPIKEPSQTLLQLSEGLKIELKGMGTQVDINEMMSPNIPAASVLGMLQEGTIPTSALIFGLLQSMSQEFCVMQSLNERFTDPDMYAKLTAGGNWEDDYAEDLYIKPTANAKFSSQAQRVQLAQVQMEQVPLVLQAGGNPMPIIKYYFDAIGSELSEAVFTDEPSEAEQAQMQQMQQAQEQQNQLLEKQNQMIEAQQQLEVMKEQRQREEAEAKIAKMQSDSDNAKLKLDADIKKILAETIETMQNAEKLDAETQAAKTQEIQGMFESLISSNVDNVSITKVN